MTKEYIIELGLASEVTKGQDTEGQPETDPVIPVCGLSRFGTNLNTCAS